MNRLRRLCIYLNDFVLFQLYPHLPVVEVTVSSQLNHASVATVERRIKPSDHMTLLVEDCWHHRPILLNQTLAQHRLAHPFGRPHSASVLPELGAVLAVILLGLAHLLLVNQKAVLLFAS